MLLSVVYLILRRLLGAPPAASCTREGRFICGAERRLLRASALRGGLVFFQLQAVLIRRITLKPKLSILSRLL